MYPDVSYVNPECILDSFEIRVKYMQNVKIHVFSWNLTEHVRYVWDTSRYIRIRVSCRIHAGYIRIRILITNPTKFDNKPHLSPGRVRVASADTACGGYAAAALESACRCSRGRREQWPYWYS